MKAELCKYSQKQCSLVNESIWCNSKDAVCNHWNDPETCFIFRYKAQKYPNDLWALFADDREELHKRSEDEINYRDSKGIRGYMGNIRAQSIQISEAMPYDDLVVQVSYLREGGRLELLKNVIMKRVTDKEAKR